MSTALHPVIRLAVWTACAATAGWLALGEAGTADAVAHGVAPEYRIAAVENGRLEQILALPGQHVRPGDVLARLDTSVLRREIAEAEAKLRESVSSTGARVVELEAFGDQTERAFQSDLDSLANQEETARATRQREASELAALREETARLEQLIRQGLARRDRLSDLELRVQTLEASAARWPAQLQALAQRREGAQRRLDDWRHQHKVQNAEHARRAALAPQVDRTAVQTEALRILRVRLANAVLTAPAEGDVISVLARAGDVARAGEPLLVMHGSGSVQIVAYLREREGDWLRSGDRALLHRRTLSRDEIPASVTRVAQQVTQLPPRFWLLPTTPAWGREVLLTLNNPQTPLSAGEAFDVRFHAAERPR